MECPICFEDVTESSNCAITECGHKFHFGCITKHTFTNGFACPLCRYNMIEPCSPDEDEDEDEYEADNWGNSANFAYKEMYDNYALQTFRMFNNLLENDTSLHEDEDEDENENENEEQYEDEDDEDNDDDTYSEIIIKEDEVKEISEYIKTKKITYEDLIYLYVNKGVMLDNNASRIEGILNTNIHKYLNKKEEGRLSDIIRPSKTKKETNIMTEPKPNLCSMCNECI